LPMIGGALAGIPTALFAFTHSLTAGIVTAIVVLAYPQIDNPLLDPVIMSKTVKISPLLVLVAVLVGASLGSLVGGLFGGFVAGLRALPPPRGRAGFRRGGAGSRQGGMGGYRRAPGTPGTADRAG